MNTPLFKAHKCRIYPTAAQRVLIHKHFGCARFVYNMALAMKSGYYEHTGKSLSRGEVSSRLTAMKKVAAFEWLKEVNSQSLQSALINVETAYRNFFKGRAGFPRFKSKHHLKQSFQCPQHVSLGDGYLNLPKIPRLKIKLTREIKGALGTVTVSRDASGKYYAAILVDTGSRIPTPSTIETDKTIGIDMGLSALAITSEGEKLPNPKFGDKAKHRLAIEQRIFARKKKDSNNRHRQKIVVARIHEKVRMQRLDSQHKATHRLVSENQATTYCVETLNIRAMARGHLARSVADTAMAQFVTLLTYKAAQAGKNVVAIGRFVPSSKVCHVCGTYHDFPKGLAGLRVREWTCVACHSHHDRDINAAMNIRDYGLADAPGHKREVAVLS